MIDLPELDAITDKVLDPGLKVIAGSEDRPLMIGDIEITAYVLEDETRVLSQRGFLTAIGRSESGGTRRDGAHKLPRFLAADNLKPFISQDMTARTNLIKFQPPSGGPPAFGYRATLLPEVCNVYLDARRAQELRANQLHVADRAELLIRGLATVGIIALIDEATGYERIRAERSLAVILEKYIAERFRPWTRTFPYEFYEQIFRLKGWGSPEGIKKPSVIGHYTNDIVYARIAPGILDELQRINPTQSSGNRRQRHHQWFTPDIGHPELITHLQRIIGMMMGSSSWDDFKRRLDRALPKVNTNLAMPLDIDD